MPTVGLPATTSKASSRRREPAGQADHPPRPARRRPLRSATQGRPTRGARPTPPATTATGGIWLRWRLHGSPPALTLARAEHLLPVCLGARPSILGRRAKDSPFRSTGNPSLTTVGGGELAARRASRCSTSTLAPYRSAYDSRGIHKRAASSPPRLWGTNRSVPASEMTRPVACDLPLRGAPSRTAPLAQAEERGLVLPPWG